jgi:hypothetical protein
MPTAPTPKAMRKSGECESVSQKIKYVQIIPIIGKPIMSLPANLVLSFIYTRGNVQSFS